MCRSWWSDSERAGPPAKEPGPPRRSRPSGRFLAAAAVLLATQAVLLAWSAAVHSPTADEVGHWPAGLSHWELRRFDLYRVNPPLVRLVATLPLALRGGHPAWSGTDFSGGPGDRPEFSIGARWIALLGPDALRQVTRARWACLPLILAGGCALALWARDLFGEPAGLVALVLWCSCPLTLGHGALMTPDAPAASLGVTACYLFRRWLRHPDPVGAVASGVALGLVQLCKLTWLVLYALWPVTWWVYRRRGGRPVPSWGREAGQLALVLAVGVYVTNLGYGFTGSFRPLGGFPFVSRALGGGPGCREVGGGRNRFAGGPLAGLPVPWPEDYVCGLDVQRREFEESKPSYLLGRWRRGGWWSYYLIGLAVKVPLGTWLLAGLGSVAAFRRRVGAGELTALLGPPAAVVVLVSSQTGMNHHVRYVLPALPFLYVLASGAVAGPAGRATRAAAAGALVWSAASSLAAYPHSLSYFNELAGGPSRGHGVLLDSNIDWGQDLLFLRDWMRRHPEARPLRLAYHGYLDPRALGVDCDLDPTGLPVPGNGREFSRDRDPRRSGWYAVSVNLLRGRSGGYADFLREAPAGRAGYSIYIYHFPTERAGGPGTGGGGP